MTTTQTRPTFTKNAHGHYACPAPGCQRAFIAPAGAGRHWAANHEVKPATNGHQPQEEADPFDLDHLRALADEVQAEKDTEQEVREEIHATLDEIEEQDDDVTHEVAERILEDLRPDLPGYNPGGHVETDRARFDGHLAKYDTARILASSMLTPDQVLDRTTCRVDVDAVLALSDATTGLVDAITRLVAIGYGRQQAHEIVLNLITKLDGRPA